MLSGTIFHGSSRPTLAQDDGCEEAPIGCFGSLTEKRTYPELVNEFPESIMKTSGITMYFCTFILPINHINI